MTPVRGQEGCKVSGYFRTIFGYLSDIFQARKNGRRTEQAKANLDPRVGPRVAPRVGPRVAPRVRPRGLPREHPRGLISLFSALQGLPTKHPTKVSTEGWTVGVHLSCFHLFCSLTKKEPKPKLLSPHIFWWGGGLPREGVGAKKFGMSLETQGIKLFWRDIPGFCRDIPEAPEKFEKKMFGFNSRPLILPHSVMISISRTLAVQLPSDTKLLLTKTYSEIFFIFGKLRISRAVP